MTIPTMIVTTAMVILIRFFMILQYTAGDKCASVELTVGIEPTQTRLQGAGPAFGRR